MISSHTRLVLIAMTLIKVQLKCTWCTSKLFYNLLQVGKDVHVHVWMKCTWWTTKLFYNLLQVGKVMLFQCLPTGHRSASCFCFGIGGKRPDSCYASGCRYIWKVVFKVANCTSESLAAEGEAAAFMTVIINCGWCFNRTSVLVRLCSLWYADPGHCSDWCCHSRWCGPKILKVGRYQFS